MSLKSVRISAARFRCVDVATIAGLWALWTVAEDDIAPNQIGLEGGGPGKGNVQIENDETGGDAHFT
jgi:hypothetical protein